MIDTTVMVSSFVELNKIFVGTFVLRFNRRTKGDTYDSGEVEAWKDELMNIEPCHYGLSEYTADQMRKETPNRVKSAHARKFAREVSRIHRDGSRNPVDGFTLAKAISYKNMPGYKGTIQMHSDSVVGATDWRDGNIVSVLRATADAQAAENGDATDEVPTMSFKSLRYIKGVLYRMIKNPRAKTLVPVRTKPLLRSPPASQPTAARRMTRVPSGVARSTAKNATTWSRAQQRTDWRTCR